MSGPGQPANATQLRRALAEAHRTRSA